MLNPDYNFEQTLLRNTSPVLRLNKEIPGKTLCFALSYVNSQICCHNCAASITFQPLKPLLFLCTGQFRRKKYPLKCPLSDLWKENIQNMHLYVYYSNLFVSVDFKSSLRVVFFYSPSQKSLL